MAKAAMILLLISNVLVVAAAAAQLSPDAEKFNRYITSALTNITEAVVSAAPPAKQKETLQASSKIMQPFKSAVAKANKLGDEKKLADLTSSVVMTSVVIKAAPPEEKLMIMEDYFNEMAAPDPRECPTVDKAFCETQSKMRQAYEGVLAVAPAEKKEMLETTVSLEITKPASSTINKAYADGDEKKIAQVLAAYSKAADEVNAAAPADKLKVMEKTFAAATAAATGN